MRRFELDPSKCLHIGDDIKIYITKKEERFTNSKYIKLCFDVNKRINISRDNMRTKKPKK